MPGELLIALVVLGGIFPEMRFSTRLNRMNVELFPDHPFFVWIFLCKMSSRTLRAKLI